ncbi:hypothetical protein ACFLR8_02010 [Bacteroidota bacterium]
MRSPIKITVILLSGILLFACSGKEQENTKIPLQPLQPVQPGVKNVAEKIIYDVEIKNPEPDNQWMIECLEGLQREELVNFLFEGIYNETFSTFDIFEGSPFSSMDIRKMEEEGQFTREQIGKFQFMEEWFLDTINMTFHKEVTEIRMGLEKFNENGELTGYDPLFRVVL